MHACDPISSASLHAYGGSPVLVLNKTKIADVNQDFSEIQIWKYFVVQTVDPIEKLFSHTIFVTTRSSKLDPMLVCSNDFFGGQKLPCICISYQSIHTRLIRHQIKQEVFGNVSMTSIGRMLSLDSVKSYPSYPYCSYVFLLATLHRLFELLMDNYQFEY